MIGVSTYLGVDPGRHGAFAAISAKTGLVRLFDMPPHRDGDRGVDMRETEDILAQMTPGTTYVGLEWNGGRPGEVPDFSYRFGLQTGQLHGMLYAYGFQISLIAPNKWTGKLGLPGKTWDGAIPQRAAMVRSLYPMAAPLILGPKGGLLDGRLDAILIAHYLRLGGESPCGHKGGRQPAKFSGAFLF